MNPIVSREWLQGALAAGSESVVVVDCRFQLGKPDAGAEAYMAGHLPGAVYLDLERDLSGPVQAHGGRHPLPDLAELSAKLGRLGIDEHTTVVAYDDQAGAMASRLWWLLRYLGHEKSAVLDGGYAGWVRAGFRVTDQPEDPAQPKKFKARINESMLASMEEVRSKLGSPQLQLVDSREPRRYQGVEEPIDKAAGHIPGAVNVFWREGLDGEANWKEAGAQQGRFAALRPEDEVIVYCGSGVTACPNILALTEAGFRKVKLYAGSWSDWISYEGNPIATGEE